MTLMWKPLVTLFLLVLTVSVECGWWRRRRRTTIIQNHHHINTNNCNCNVIIKELLARIEKLEKAKGRRDVAALLDIEESYPGLDKFVDHLDTKRDGSVDMEALETILKRATSTSLSALSNVCHCGRSLVDSFNFGLL